MQGNYFIIINDVQNDDRIYSDSLYSIRFNPADKYYVYSMEDNSLEGIMGDFLNYAIALLGEDKFCNYRNSSGLSVVVDCNILCDILGCTLKDNIMYIAYRGYIFKIMNIGCIEYIKLEDYTLEIKVVVDNVTAFAVFDRKGLAYTSEGFRGAMLRDSIELVDRYEDDKAGIALCRYLI